MHVEGTRAVPDGLLYRSACIIRAPDCGRGTGLNLKK
jgi:hypothetical protein